MDAFGAGAGDRGSATCIPPPPSPFFISYTRTHTIFKWSGCSQMEVLALN